MIKIFRFCIIFFIATLLCSVAVAAENDAGSQSQSPAQTNKMLKEIQALQNKEAQKDFGDASASGDDDAAQSSSSVPTVPGTNANTSQAAGATPKKIHVKPKYHSNFQFPHSRAQIQNSSEEDALNRTAFAGAVQQALPLNPTQIHRLKQIYDAAQFAAAAPAGTPPKPVATSLFVHLAPGSTPPVIRLSEGFVTSLVFLDSTGSPWPIAAYDLGNPNAFDVAWDKKDNVLMVQAKTLYTYGNLAVRLRGLNTPIMLTLIPGQSVVDYRTDITVPGRGPDAKTLPINTGLPPQATPILLNVLDGVPPKGSKQLQIAPIYGKAWSLHGKMYLRTQFTLLSPGWLATMSSGDGTNAYELQPTPMLLMSEHGKIQQVKVGGL